jgi:hypothetical protein
LSCLALLGTVLFGGQLACAPAKLLDSPAGWPVEWKNRKLYNTPNALIYAGSAAAAGEADRLVASVARTFREENQSEPSKPLIIVSGSRDQPIVDDQVTLLRLAKRSEAQRETAERVSGEEIEKEIAEMQAKMRDEGVSMDATLKIMPITMDRQILAEFFSALQGPDDRVRGGVAFSTKAVVRRSAKEMMQASLEHQDIGPLARIGLAPVLGFVQGMMVDTLLLMRNVAVYAMWIDALPDLTRDQKHARIEAYAERIIEKKLTGSVTKMKANAPSRAGTQDVPPPSAGAP